MTGAGFVERFYTGVYLRRQLDLDEIRNTFDKIRTLWPDAQVPLTVLDVGCGAGSVSAELVQRGHSVIGIDVLPEAVRRARQKGLDARVGDVQAGLPMPSESVDVVIAMDILEHLLDPMALLQEIRRVLKPAGFLITAMPLHFDLVQRIRTFLTGAMVSYEHLGYDPSLRTWEYYHVHFFNLREALGFFDAAGFVMEAKEFRPIVSLPLVGEFGRKRLQRLLWFLARRIPALFSTEIKVRLRKSRGAS